MWVVCGLTLFATVILVRALTALDFRWRYVGEHTSSDLPMLSRVSSLWAGQEGSLLLWLLILSGYGAAFLYAYRKRLDPFYDGGDAWRRSCVLHGAPGVRRLAVSHPATRRSMNG